MPYSLFPGHLFGLRFDVLNSMVLQDLLKKVLSKKDEYGDNWLAMRHKLLSIYVEALSSTCTGLVQMMQVVMLTFFFMLDSSHALVYIILNGNVVERNSVCTILMNLIEILACSIIK